MHKAIKSGGSLRARIAALAALCWLIPTVVLGVYINNVLTGTLREKTERALISGASHAQELVVQEIENVLAKSREVTYEGQFYGFVDDYRDGTVTYETFYLSARAAWQKLFQRDRLYTFTAFFLLDEPENILYTGDSIDTLHTFEESVMPVMLEGSEAMDTRSHFLYVNGTLYHIRNLIDRRLERFGMIALGLYPQRLLSPMLTRDAMWYGSVDIVLDDYQSIANDLPLDVADFRTGLYEEGDSLYYAQQIKTSDYTFSYRMRVDKASIYGEADGYFRLTLALVLLLVPAALLAGWYAHRRVALPILSLADALSRTGEPGNPGPAVAIRGRGEIAALADAYNGMRARLQLQNDRADKEEIVMGDAKIAAMRGRLALRFASATTQILSERAQEHGDTSCIEMLDRLTTLLLATQDLGGTHTVLLSDELQTVDVTLYLVRQRFGQRIAIQQEIDPNLLFVDVPKLSVVMLLESAVERCLAHSDGGMLRLRVYAMGGSVRIDIHSRGKRWTEDDRLFAKRWAAGEADDGLDGAPSVHNIDSRLKKLYGDGAGLTATVDDSGMSTGITIPIGEAHTERIS